MKKLPFLVLATACIQLLSHPAAQAEPLSQKVEKAQQRQTQAVSKLDINSANAEALQQLPGIGKKKALAIIAYRDKNGAFKTVAELAMVKGIGTKMVAKLQGDVEVR